MSERSFRDRLRRRFKRAGVNLSSDLEESLERYFEVLAKWNAKINLTSYKLDTAGHDEAIDRLLVEPVIAAGYVPEKTVTAIDVGSGGGSPAIPLTLAAPRLQMRMVESKTRKAVFLREALRTLGLGRAEVDTARFEELLTRPALHEAADLITVRAVRVEPRTLVSLQALLKPGGHLFLFRGPSGANVAESLTPPLAWVATYPMVEALRSRLVVLEKDSRGR